MVPPMYSTLALASLSHGPGLVAYERPWFLWRTEDRYPVKKTTNIFPMKTYIGALNKFSGGRRGRVHQGYAQPRSLGRRGPYELGAQVGEWSVGGVVSLRRPQAGLRRWHLRLCLEVSLLYARQPANKCCYRHASSLSRHVLLCTYPATRTKHTQPSCQVRSSSLIESLPAKNVRSKRDVGSHFATLVVMLVLGWNRHVRRPSSHDEAGQNNHRHN